MIAPGLFFIRVCLSADFSFVLTWDLGSLWFTGHTLFYLLFRGFYHYGIRKGSGLKAPAEPSRAELPTRRVKFLFSKTSSEEINHKYFLYKIIT